MKGPNAPYPKEPEMRLPVLLALAAAVSALATPAARAANGYFLRAVAVEGDPAPGTATTFGAPMDATVTANGAVGFAAPLAGGPLDGGVWIDTGAGPVLQLRTGDPAPGSGGGSFLALGGFVENDATGQLGFSAYISGGSSTTGLFPDGGAALLLGGEPAPAGIGGTLTASLGDINVFGMGGAGELVFRSAVAGGSTPSGLFAKSGGVVTTVAAEGDAAPGSGGGSYARFEYPARNAAGAVTFAAEIAGGTASWGLYADSGSGPVLLALDGDPAPETGGATFSDFLYPALASGGDVGFLADAAGGAASGGVFRTTATGLEAVAVENGAAPGTGGGHYVSVNSIPVFAGDDLVFSAGVAGGDVDGGVFVRSAGASAVPVALAGESVSGVAGAVLASFALLAANDAGDVAFVATLDDGRTGVFLASAPQAANDVPALPPAGLFALAALLVAAGLGGLRAGARPRT